MARTITLRSPLAPIALAATLRDVLGKPEDTPRAGVCGQGSEQDMMLFVYRPYVRNAFATTLFAALDADGKGTRITGEIGTPFRAGSCMILLFGLMALTLLAAALGAGEGAPPGFWAPMAGVALGTSALGWLIWRLGTWAAARDKAAILAFLADTVQAKET